MKKPLADKGPRRIERVVLADQVYELLKERILDRQMDPGMRLNIDALARELSVSSSPLREALTRLAAEGLVRASPFVGFSVAPLPDHQYFEDLFHFRVLLEPWAAAEAARKRTPELIAELTAAIEGMEKGSLARHYRKNRGFHAADEAFHRAIAEATGNKVVTKIYQDLNAHLHHSRLYIEREQDSAATCREHKRILEAMRAHLLSSKRRLID
jgi:DNA-binding GntR family transcriptional regulator